ncbi:hypothetical protein BG61_03010 [Caballeronia glathei]|uniref:Uncharacterized protein n=1 Tax=Caballeronia glathei TaxID=60547 RepID=A0A069PLQ4_9BURK|nr:hypothetical protein BG61_03010 [Caballeronia glathei]
MPVKLDRLVWACRRECPHLAVLARQALQVRSARRTRRVAEAAQQFVLQMSRKRADSAFTRVERIICSTEPNRPALTQEVLMQRLQTANSSSQRAFRTHLLEPHLALPDLLVQPVRQHRTALQKL